MRGELRSMSADCNPATRNSMAVSSEMKYSLRKHEFLLSVSSDLRRIGISGQVLRKNGALIFTADLGNICSSRLVEFMEQERLRRNLALSGFINKMAVQGMATLLADGRHLDVGTIRPRIQFCRSDWDLAVFRFCRLMQSVPTSKLMYRQIAALLRDDGQNGSPLIGAFGLSSPVYSLGCRDDLWKWRRRKRVKISELKQCMQLSVCMAVPPYNSLRAARLVAALAASKEVAAEFHKRYAPNQLHAIITTSAKGIHSPIFNRIMLRPGGLYRRIGETTGYSTLFFSENTLAAAKRLSEASGGPRPAITGRPMRVLKRALSLCKLPKDRFLQLGVTKGVYVALSGGKATAFLSGDCAKARTQWPSLDEVISYWRTRDLPKALIKSNHLATARYMSSKDIFSSWTGIIGAGS